MLTKVEKPAWHPVVVKWASISWPFSWTLHLTMSSKSIFQMRVTCWVTHIVTRALSLYWSQWISQLLTRACQQLGRGFFSSVEAHFNGGMWGRKFLGETFQWWTSNCESNLLRTEHCAGCHRQKNSGIRLKIWTSWTMCPATLYKAMPIHHCPTIINVCWRLKQVYRGLRSSDLLLHNFKVSTRVQWIFKGVF